MGIFGGSSSKPALQSRRASELLIESMFPGFQAHDGNRAGVSGELVDYFERTGQYADGMPTFGSSLGSGPGLLPSIGEMGDFNTVFEKYSNGALDPSSQIIMDTMMTNLAGGEGSVFAQGMAAIGGSFSAAQGGVGGAAPDLSQLQFQEPDNTGVYVSEIFNSLPPQFQSFVDDIMGDATQASIDAELNNLSSALLSEAQLNANSLGNQLLNSFAAEGLGASGSAQQALTGLASEITIRVNAQVAQARLGALDTLMKNKQIAQQSLDTMMQAGTSERMQDVQGQLAAIDATARVIAAQLQAQASIQAGLYSAQANLSSAQLGFIDNAFNQLVNQSTMEETFRRDAQLLPYEILGNLATGMSPISKESSNIGGEIIGGIAGVAAAKFGGPPS